MAGRKDGFFHGYYDHYCYLPLYVTCGAHLLVAYLRPSRIDPARHAWAVLALLVRHLRRQWPGVKIIFRADSGFCRWRLLRWCERHVVGYIVGIGKNARLMDAAGPLVHSSRQQHECSGQKIRLFDTLSYAARTWDRQRRLIAKAEHSSRGANTRFVVTNLPGAARSSSTMASTALAGRWKTASRSSSLICLPVAAVHSAGGLDQLRILLSALAYVLLAAIRRLALARTELDRATCGTIRLKLIKIGAVVISNTRRISFKLSSAYPHKELFSLVAWRLGAT